MYRPVGSHQAARSRQVLGLEATDYFLHVGNLSMKKNLAMAVEAFLNFKRRTGFDGVFVLAGASYPKGRDERFFDLIATPEARGAVTLTGHVPQEHLAGLYAGALAFLFPSLHEGFGLAPLEAMACGAPVIAHAGEAVREVVGEAGILLDSATDTGEWSRAMERVAYDSALRQRLSEAGLIRASRFTGDRTARETLGVYEEVARTSRSTVKQRSRSASPVP